MQQWWNENGPPVYLSVAAYLGLIKGRSSGYGDLDDLELAFSGSGGVIGA